MFFEEASGWEIYGLAEGCKCCHRSPGSTEPRTHAKAAWSLINDFSTLRPLRFCTSTHWIDKCFPRCLSYQNLRLQALRWVIGREVSRTNPGLHKWQFLPAVLWRQFKQTPPELKWELKVFLDSFYVIPVSTQSKELRIESASLCMLVAVTSWKKSSIHHSIIQWRARRASQFIYNRLPINLAIIHASTCLCMPTVGISKCSLKPAFINPHPAPNRLRKAKGSRRAFTAYPLTFHTSFVIHS